MQDIRHNESQNVGSTQKYSASINHGNMFSIDAISDFHLLGQSQTSFLHLEPILISFWLFEGAAGESALRCKARLERHQRTVERAVCA